MTLYELRAGLAAIFGDAAGLPVTSVIFGDVVPQVAPKSYLRVADVSDRSSNPEARWSHTPGNPAGAELTETTVLQTWTDWRIELLCPEPGTAVSLLRQALVVLASSTMQDRLDAFGCALVNNPGAQRLPVVKDSVYRDRAVATLTLSLLVSHDDLSTFIQSIQGTATIGVTGKPNIVVPFTVP